MPAKVVRYASRAELLRREKAAELRQLVLGFEAEAPAAVGRVLAVIDRNTAAEKGWSFVMLGPPQNRAVVRWITENAKRPRLSLVLWAELFCHMRTDTGEIFMSRAELAEAVGCPPTHISAALSELLGMGALIRQQEGREVRWFMNPCVGTRLGGAAREKAQRAAPPLLSVVQGAAQKKRAGSGRTVPGKGPT